MISRFQEFKKYNIYTLYQLKVQYQNVFELWTNIDMKKKHLTQIHRIFAHSGWFNI